jgi:1-aminocyclopropane-1-carboxylate deaminase/D-cysteine desulfhydrase-like pyridoxal-dependent ACC family enzyme
LLKSHGIEIDLIYATKAWKALLENWLLFETSQLLYIHTGMLKRGNEKRREVVISNQIRWIIRKLNPVGSLL